MRWLALLLLVLTAQAEAQSWITSQVNEGLTLYKDVDADETEDAVKTAKGVVYGYYLFNKHTTEVRYFKFYDATVASVTVGTTTPVLTIPVPPNSAANVFSTIGLRFATAITLACVTGVLDSDTTAPGANECVADIYYR